MPFAIAKFLQHLPKGFHERLRWLARLQNAHAVYFSGRCLCARGKRPSGRQASNHFDEISPAHAILPVRLRTTPVVVLTIAD